jgi:hypothetical protein
MTFDLRRRRTREPVRLAAIEVKPYPIYLVSRNPFFFGECGFGNIT